MFRKAWDGKASIRLLGVHAGSLEASEGQMSLLDEPETERLRRAFRSVDHIRNRFGAASISFAKSLQTGIRERVHENPFDLPGKEARDKPSQDD
jgi:DNA polymerase-4